MNQQIFSVISDTSCHVGVYLYKYASTLNGPGETSYLCFTTLSRGKQVCLFEIEQFVMASNT